MTTELCPTGGRENILRFEKSVVGKTTNADQRSGMTKPDDGGGDVCFQVQVDDPRDDDTVPVNDSGDTAHIKTNGGSDEHVQIPDRDGRGDDAVHNQTEYVGYQGDVQVKL